MHSLTTRAGMSVSAIALVVLAAACGSSKPAAKTSAATITAGFSAPQPVVTRPKPKPKPSTPAEIRRAALFTAAKPGYRAAVSASIKVPQLGSGPIKAVGTGYFDSKSGTGTVGVALTLPGLMGLAGALPAQVVAVGDEVYIKLPDELTTISPTLKPWQEASLAQLDLSTLDPSIILGQIARDATRKVPYQNAKVTINAETGLIRTILLTYYEPGPRIRVAIDLTLTGFGTEPASAAPPSDQTGELIPALTALGF